ncbi:MAG: 5-formyltetrahydrofolate cyclo-ligase [Candidatus Pelagibacter sp.]|nr:5-formyltetrahydrofolate cyclo-ligase [Candidatus Pelagibacter sp.]|tara:strand:+ start:39 stop:362 length:324 start_codon:yes stop_codon:yes gene_type:complete
MKSFNEKEKKLVNALEKLKNLKFEQTKNNKSISIIEEEKNQLEIEKKDLENNYAKLKLEYDILQNKMEKLKHEKSQEIKKENNFKEKLDELNQETDSLLDEINKWQM